jgi:uncharacterized protein (DUF2141 family)
MKNQLFVLLCFSTLLFTSFDSNLTIQINKEPFLINFLDKSKGSIEIIVNGIKSTNGQINVALYNTSATFNIIEKVYFKQTYIIKGKSIIITIPNVPVGEYAISLFHDVNKNLQIDKNMLGIPKEGFAFSNNATANFGPPKWSSAKFSVMANKKHIQNLNLIHY